MKFKGGWITAAFAALAFVGFLLPFWPLSAVGIILLCASGRWLVAIGAALLLDLAWGVPVGFMHVLYFPFTLLAVLGALARGVLGRYLIDTNPPETL